MLLQNKSIEFTKTISEIIGKFEAEQRAELVDFYSSTVNEKLDDGKPLEIKKILLFLDLCKYLPSEERDAIVKKAVNIKVSQISGFVLENLKDDFTKEKTHFSTVSKWMTVVIKEIYNTFNSPYIFYERKNIEDTKNNEKKREEASEAHAEYIEVDESVVDGLTNMKNIDNTVSDGAKKDDIEKVGDIKNNDRSNNKSDDANKNDKKNNTISKPVYPAKNTSSNGFDTKKSTMSQPSNSSKDSEINDAKDKNSITSGDSSKNNKKNSDNNKVENNNVSTGLPTLTAFRKKVISKFHEKLCAEFSLIFCSSCSAKKFNSAGNQLLIDLAAYFENFLKNDEKMKNDFYEKIERNFMPEACFSRKKIQELYNNTKKQTSS